MINKSHLNLTFLESVSVIKYGRCKGKVVRGGLDGSNLIKIRSFDPLPRSPLK